MSTQLTKEQIAELKETFVLFDKNGDGSISKDEFKEALRLFGQKPTDMQLQEMINSVDKDGSGAIEFSEFTILMGKHLKEKDSEVELKAAFNFFDIDRDGFITAPELRVVLRKLGEKMTDEEIDDIVKEGDKDGDGRINYQEFLDIMES